ncbi:LytR/AlgR family response regulator transcription factor [Spirosoma pollinicola]|uniref:DNA-binding response regulator n=1 Tax=Spirosoma pollinicola TaxID=2057025 RepID=A0A2K8YWQ9_9BACT|nr:LytTR family DNA-binding domain-containing protein [Spirosoma pollinicola]AUD02067.1 DNA-binding response regulator [Spirosoma pollinicola]
MTPSLHCYIIDDELPARTVLEKFIQRVPFLELVGQSDNAVDALFAIQQARPDLIFLDIEMPEMTGIEFLKALGMPRPQVIMITASPQYAVEGFELNVVDYLLKPVAFDRFLRAINKVKREGTERINPVPSTLPAPVAQAHVPLRTETDIQLTAEGDAEFFLVREDKKLIRVVPNEIVLIEAMKDYLTIHLKGRTIVVHMTLAKMEDMLPTAHFLRVNRSYIVRKAAIKEIDGNLITTIDDKRVPIGVTYRDSVWEAMKKNIM